MVYVLRKQTKISYNRYYTGSYPRKVYQVDNNSDYLYRKIRKVGVGIFILSLVVAGVLGVNRFGSSHSANAEAETTLGAKTDPKPTPPPPIDEAALATAINAIIAKNPGLDIGVSVHDLSNNKSYDYGVENPFVGASVSKLLSATLFLKEVENGKYKLTQQIGDKTAEAQIQAMVAKSDNDAWHAINDELGHPALKTYADSIGLTSYDPEKNTITSANVGVLLHKLYKRELLNDGHTRILLASMKQDAEEIQFIRNYIDPSIVVYHKAGWLNDRAHDTAIIENGDRPFVLVIFTKARYGNYDFSRGQKLFADFTTSIMQIMKPTPTSLP
jgi:beta-lactamase class A